jgi:hypothetical protein
MPRTTPESTVTVPRLGYARTSDGRVGTVVGYYHREDPTVLVRFASGESEEFPTEGVELFV